MKNLKRLVSKIMACSFLFFSAIGCGSDVEIVENKATMLLCLQEEDTSQYGSIEEAKTLELVVFEECFDLSKVLEIATCSVSAEGDEFVVHSRFEYRHTGDDAPDVCGSALVRCNIGELSEGTHMIGHGGVQREFSVPSDDNLDCQRVREQEQLAPEPIRF